MQRCGEGYQPAELTPPGHINNLYNTTFWSMVNKGGMSGTEAELALKASISFPQMSLKSWV